VTLVLHCMPEPVKYDSQNMKEPLKQPLISAEDSRESGDAQTTASETSSQISEMKSPGHYMLNLIHLSTCFFLVFTAFSAIQNLAASEYRTPWIGAVSLALLYVIFTLTCIVGPFIYEKLGIKWSVAIALMGYTAYALASMVAVYFNDCVDDHLANSTLNGSALQGSGGCGQFDTSKSADANRCSDYGHDVQDSCCACGGGSSTYTDKMIQVGVLFPGAAICGISASFLWTAQGAYVAQNAQFYHRTKGALAGKVGEDIGDVNLSLGLFNGIFFAFFQATQITGNMLAGILRTLGLKDIILFFIYVIFAVLGTALAFFLRSVPKPPTTGKRPSVCVELIATLKLLTTDWTMVALIPIIMYNGLEMGFIWGDFTTYYANVGLGASRMPFIMVAFGGADVLASLGFGKLSDVIGRLPVMLIGAVAQVTVLIGSFFYTIPKLKPDAEPSVETWAVMIVAVVLWGIGDAVWNTQIMVILGENFDKQKPAAFANFKMWQALATAISFGYNPVLGTNVKKFILLALLGVGLLGYFAAMFGWRAQKKP